MTEAVLRLTDPQCHDVEIAGGKGASLASMTAAGLPVPPGFVVTAGVLASSVDRDRLIDLARRQAHEDAVEVVRKAVAPRDLIASAYEQLGGGAVAVRSSACAEDSETASFAGQQDTYLNVAGAEAVVDRVIDCWASFFSERAMFYRARKGSLEDLAMAVVVQKMVEPTTSGVLFTADPVQRRRDRMIVEAITGLGEQVVSGEVTPDHYVLSRSGEIKREILPNGGVLAAQDLCDLVELGAHLEDHFGGPQDVEWAMASGEVFLLQSRPITTL